MSDFSNWECPHLNLILFATANDEHKRGPPGDGKGRAPVTYTLRLLLKSMRPCQSKGHWSK